MMPIQGQQHIPLGSNQQIHHQMTPQGSAAHVIITNEAPAVTIDGDRAFAIRFVKFKFMLKLKKYTALLPICFHCQNMLA